MNFLVEHELLLPSEWISNLKSVSWYLSSVTMPFRVCFSIMEMVRTVMPQRLFEKVVTVVWTRVVTSEVIRKQMDQADV